MRNTMIAAAALAGLTAVPNVGQAEGYSYGNAFLVTAGVGGLHARHVDVDLDRGFLGYFCDLDVAVELGEATTDLGEAQMAADELNRAV